MEPAVVVRTDGSAVREFDIDDSLSLYRAGTERVVILNGSARLLWQQLADPTPLDQLVDLLAHEYDVAPDDIADDVAIALETLRDEGLVRLCP